VSDRFSKNRRPRTGELVVLRQPTGEKPDDLDRRTISAEANLLRFPLFALQTKGLRSLDGIECSGKVMRDEVTYSYTLKATRNTDTLYPGPLARAANLAFTSMITDEGLPFKNPLSWSWRGLCSRLGIVCSGRTVDALKEAIRSTALLGIQSNCALYSKVDKRPIQTQEAVLHLYDKVTFVGSELPGGGIAEKNCLWLSDWYLGNLNAFFTAPLDYELWKLLDAKSTIASRLYEFLFLNFNSEAPLLRINYQNLVRFLPVKSMVHYSWARDQLDAPFDLLAAANVVEKVQWLQRPKGIAQIHIYPGNVLTPARNREQTLFPLMEEDLTGEIEVRELRNIKPPEWGLVADFYRLWSDQRFPQPTPKELAQAQELIKEHGEKKAKAIIPLVVEVMRTKWPDAKSFGAVGKYAPEAAQAYDAEQRRLSQREKERRKVAEEKERLEQERRERSQLKAEWDAISGAEREKIIEEVKKRHSSLRVSGFVLETLCLEEFRKRRGGVQEQLAANYR
jgi:hypothetical protein